MRPSEAIKLHHVWRLMRERCSDPRRQSYHRYGGRGITICEEWRDFDTFVAWAEASGYEPGLTIDRIDNDGNYEPSNCRWATPSQQARNRRTTRLLTVWGETKCLKDWVEDERCIVGYMAVFQRLGRGWTPEQALSLPPRTVVFPGPPPPRWPDARTHCPQGHPYDEANTRISKEGHRACRACKRERARTAYREGRWVR